MTAVLIEHPAKSRHALRQRLTTLIDRLILALDQIDGDPDFEDEEDDQCDDEGAIEDDNDTSDLEPSLCGVDMSVRHALGTFRNGELHHDLEEER